MQVTKFMKMTTLNRMMTEANCRKLFIKLYSCKGLWNNRLRMLFKHLGRLTRISLVVEYREIAIRLIKWIKWKVKTLANKWFNKRILSFQMKHNRMKTNKMTRMKIKLLGAVKIKHLSVVSNCCFSNTSFSNRGNSLKAKSLWKQVLSERKKWVIMRLIKWWQRINYFLTSLLTTSQASNKTNKQILKWMTSSCNSELVYKSVKNVTLYLIG